MFTKIIRFLIEMIGSYFTLGSFIIFLGSFTIY